MSKTKRCTILMNGKKYSALRRDIPPAKMSNGMVSIHDASRMYSIDDGKSWFYAR